MTDDGSFYRPGKSIQEFHEDHHFVRVLIGGRGSGKPAEWWWTPPATPG